MTKNLNKNVKSALKDESLENAVGGYIIKRKYDVNYVKVEPGGQRTMSKGIVTRYILVDDRKGKYGESFSTLENAEAAAKTLGLSTKLITDDGVAYLQGRYGAKLAPNAAQ